MPFKNGDRVKLVTPLVSSSGHPVPDAGCLGTVVGEHPGNMHTIEDMVVVLFDSGGRQLLYSWRFQHVP